MASLSDEETARALCAFQHTEPLPTQRRQPLQQPLYQPHSEIPQLTPDARVDGLSTFGYPTNATYHMVPMSRRNEAASVLMGMHTPSTSSDDWQRLQQRTIQEQIEQEQRELQGQFQQQQRRDMQMQLQRVQAQMQQQEQAQIQQMQRIQPRYSGFEQTRWRNEADTSLAMSSFHGGSQAMQQSSQVYDGRFGRSQQVPIRPTPAFTSAPISSFASDYRASSQPGVSVTRSNGMFAPQQVPQPAQSHLQPRNSENLETSAFHQWERKDSMLFGGIPTDRTKTLQMQTAQRYIPHQPQPYYPIKGREPSRQETTTRRNPSRSSNDAFLSGVMKHFPSSAGSDSAPPANAGASTGSNYAYAEARTNNPLFSSIPIQPQGRIQTPTQMQMQVQMNAQPRPSVPPAGSAVIPGVSLASPSVRLLTMRDILNSEDVPNKLDSSRNRQRGDKQKRDPSKRKTPRKQTTAKRRRIPQQENKQRSQPLQSNRPVGGIVSRQGASLAPSKSAVKPSTPMYRAFMESRAARASEQAAGITNTRPSVPSVLPAHMTQLPTKSDSRMSDAPANLIAGMKKLDAPSRSYYPSSTYQTNQQPGVSTSAPAQGATKPKAPFDNPERTATESLHSVGERQALVNGQAQSADDFDSPMDEVSEQQLQPHPPQLSVSTTVVRSVQPSVKLDVVGNGKAGTSSKKRRRPVADSNRSPTGNLQQHVPTALPSTQGLSKVTSTATASTAFSVVQTPAVSELPCVENRTVVIFCKRDFMRYQAAKIWRKYQEQLKKHDEWREIRVAGKRTRYLNSRYDELQRTPRRTYTRSGKPRRKASKEAKGTCSQKESLFTTDSTPVDSTVSSSMPVDNEGEDICMTREPDPKGDGESAGSEVLSSVDDVQSLSEKPGAADKDNPLAAPFSSESSQRPQGQIEDGTKSAVKQSVSRDPRSDVVGGSVAQSGLDDTMSDGNLPTAVNANAHNSDAVADALPNDNKEPSSAVHEVIPVVANAEPENIDPSVADLSCSGSAESTDTVTTVADETPITESLSSCRIDATSSDLENSVGTAVAVASTKGNVTATAVADPSPNGNIEVIDSATDVASGSAVGESVPTDVYMGVKQSTDEESEGSLSDVKRLGEENLHDKLTDTNSATMSINGAVDNETKRHRSDCDTLRDVHPDKPTRTDPVTNSNGDAAA